MYDFYDLNFEGAKQSAPSETECAHSKPEHACIPLERVHFSVDTHTQTLIITALITVRTDPGC